MNGLLSVDSFIILFLATPTHEVYPCSVSLRIHPTYNLFVYNMLFSSTLIDGFLSLS